ncbi:unnamed protein product [Schistosoma haematobium]|nr:unnamed protein product [Schistosoma haematobium]
MLTYGRFTADFRQQVINERLQEMGLLRSSCTCECGCQMTGAKCPEHRGEIVFRCPSCWKKTSARTGTFFARSRLSLRQIMIIVANWLIKTPVTLAAAFADVTETSAVQWYEYCRDICASKMTRLRLSFGGVGCIVEIDETVVRKRKYNRGRGIKEEWVSSISVNILDRYLEFMTDQHKRDIFRKSETGKRTQSYQLYRNTYNWAQQYIRMIGEAIGAYIDLDMCIML